jgi:Spherulation-specific family 4
VQPFAGWWIHGTSAERLAEDWTKHAPGTKYIDTDLMLIYFWDGISLRQLGGSAGEGGPGPGGGGGGLPPVTEGDEDVTPILYVPQFIYPNPLDDWQRLADLKTLVPQLEIWAGINENNGDGADNTHPFTARNADFANGITLLDNAGIKCVGYTYTGYGTRSSTLIQQIMDAYKTYYPEIRGIFFDEMPNTVGASESYMQSLSDYAHNTKGFEITMGNPGTAISSSYVGTVDTALIYESSGQPSLSTLNTRTFTGTYVNNKKKFGSIPFNVSSITTYGMRDMLRYVGVIYSQDDNLPNPWDTLPAYLEQLAITVANGPK